MDRPTVWNALMRPPWRFLFGRWPWLALAYGVLSALLGLVLLPLAVVTLLLLPLWGLAVGAVERRRTRLLGFPRQTSGHVPLGREQRHIWLSVRLSEGATWRETAALLVDLVLGLVAVMTLVAEQLFLGVLVAIGVMSTQRPPTRLHLLGDVWIVVGADTWWPVIPIGLVSLAVFAYLNALLFGGQAALLRLLCGPRLPELTRNVERLTRSRATLVAAFEAERRRIERDLHDGVQQELVTLAARLGLVSLELDDLEANGVRLEPVRAALDVAQGQAEHAMAVLRNTVRGIHPAVLTDHGLEAALRELADRSPLALRLEVDGLGRMPSPVETAAYYLVTEAMSNAAKHTAATRIDVHVAVRDGALAVAVADDGHGGADESTGTGLRGLRERAETLGGRFTVVSPPGGPTMLHLVLPLIPERAVSDAAAAR